MEIKKIEWRKSLEPVLKRVLNDDLPQIREEVKSGISELWDIEEYGYTITRIEPNKNGLPYELVFVAGIGENAKEVIKHFQAIAKTMNIKKMRIHSTRPGMGRYLKSLNFETEEIIYRASI